MLTNHQTATNIVHPYIFHATIAQTCAFFHPLSRSFILHKFSPHAHLHALLEPAILAPVSRSYGDGTLRIRDRRGAPVAHFSSNRPFEESFATFARNNSVMSARSSVTAHTTHRPRRDFSRRFAERVVLTTRTCRVHRVHG